MGVQGAAAPWRWGWRGGGASLSADWDGWTQHPGAGQHGGRFQEGASPLEQVSTVREEGTVYLLSQAGSCGRFQRGPRPPWLWVSNRGERRPVGTRSCCARSSVLYLLRPLAHFEIAHLKAMERWDSSIAGSCIWSVQ